MKKKNNQCLFKNTLTLSRKRFGAWKSASRSSSYKQININMRRLLRLKTLCFEKSITDNKNITLWIKPSSIIEQLSFLNNSCNASTSFTETENTHSNPKFKTLELPKEKVLNFELQNREAWKPIDQKDQTRKPTLRIMSKTSQIRVLACLSRSATTAIEALSNGGEEDINNDKERHEDGAELLSNCKRAWSLWFHQQQDQEKIQRMGNAFSEKLTEETFVQSMTLGLRLRLASLISKMVMKSHHTHKVRKYIRVREREVKNRTERAIGFASALLLFFVDSLCFKNILDFITFLPIFQYRFWFNYTLN